MTTSLLLLVPDVPDVPSLDEEELSSVEEVDEVVLEAAVVLDVGDVASAEELSVLDAISWGGGGGGGIMVSPALPDAAFSDVEVVLSVVPASFADDDADVDSAGGGGIMAPSVPFICSCSDSRADCMSPPSDEKAFPDDTVEDVEPLP